MNENIEVIADNGGGITIQNTATKAVAHFADIDAAREDLSGVLAGDDMSGWELSDPDCYITDEQYSEHESSGGYKSLTAEAITEMIQCA